jgi:hypothetical protein
MCTIEQTPLSDSDIRSVRVQQGVVRGACGGSIVQHDARERPINLESNIALDRDSHSSRCEHTAPCLCRTVQTSRGCRNMLVPTAGLSGRGH